MKRGAAKDAHEWKQTNNQPNKQTDKQVNNNNNGTVSIAVAAAIN